jgi:hypothetical protein
LSPGGGNEDDLIKYCRCGEHGLGTTIVRARMDPFPQELVDELLRRRAQSKGGSWVRPASTNSRVIAWTP